jgi:hypothetical protein
MIDKTTEGYVAEPSEVEAVLHNLCGYHLSEPDPRHRYEVLTREQVLYDSLVDAIKRERGRALADMVSAGHSLTSVAEQTNLRTRQRVQRLIAISKAAEEAAAAVQAASRDFHERLAAVEATLDEVVSGVMAEASMPEVEAAAERTNVPDQPKLPAESRPPRMETLPEFDPALTEQTQVLPALATVMHAADLQEESTPWWRRSRDTGAA